MKTFKELFEEKEHEVGDHVISRVEKNGLKKGQKYKVTGRSHHLGMVTYHLDAPGAMVQGTRNLKRVTESEEPTAQQHLKWATKKFKKPRAQASNLYHYHLLQAKHHQAEADKHPAGSAEHRRHTTDVGFHMLRAKHYSTERKTAPIRKGRAK